MSDIKNRMYNFETPPPDGIWDAIAADLDRNEAKVIPISSKKKNYTFYYIAAASVGIILFCLILFTNRSHNSNPQLATGPYEVKKDNASNNDSTNNTVMMTVPIEEKPNTKNNTNPDNSLAPNKAQKELPNKKQTKEEAKKSFSTDNELIASNSPAKYMTIEGPQGQPVKVSSKMALLIDSSETKIASKPIWNKKINEWREIMKGNTLAPTPGNFLDIMELTKTLKDHK
jgi:hypothetical protein